MICIQQFFRFVEYCLIGVFDLIPSISISDVAILEYLIEGVDFIEMIMFFLVYFTLVVFWWSKYLELKHKEGLNRLFSYVEASNSISRTIDLSASSLKPMSPRTPSKAITPLSPSANLKAPLFLERRPNTPYSAVFKEITPKVFSLKNQMKKHEEENQANNNEEEIDRDNNQGILETSFQTIPKGKLRKMLEKSSFVSHPGGKGNFSIPKEMNFFYYLVCFLLLLLTVVLFMVCVVSPLTPQSVIYKTIRLVYKTVIDGIVIVVLLILGIKLFSVYRQRFRSIPNLGHLKKTAIITILSTTLYIFMIFINFICFFYSCIANMTKEQECYFKYDNILSGVNSFIEIVISLLLIFLILPTPKRIRENVQLFESSSSIKLDEQMEEDTRRAQELLPDNFDVELYEDEPDFQLRDNTPGGSRDFFGI